MSKFPLVKGITFHAMALQAVSTIGTRSDSAPRHLGFMCLFSILFLKAPVL